MFHSSCRTLSVALFVFFCQVLASPLLAQQPAPEAMSLRDAMAHESRPSVDRQYDDHFYAEDVLSFAGVKPGVRMAFIGSAGVYYTSIASLVAGPQGKIYVHNASWSVQEYPSVLNNWYGRMVNSPMHNISPIITDMDEIDFPELLDLVFIDRFYHDVVRNRPNDVDAMNRSILASLKPGGHYVVLDHAARPGTGTSEAWPIHRIEQSAVVQQVEAAGFELVDESEAARNPDDDRTGLARRDNMTNTDRFLLKFERPSS